MPRSADEIRTHLHKKLTLKRREEEERNEPTTSALLTPFPYKKCSCAGTPTCKQIADAFPGIHFSCDECEHDSSLGGTLMR